MTDKPITPEEQQRVYQTVRDGYAEIADSGSTCCGTSQMAGGGCCGGSDQTLLSADALAEQIGYTPEQMKALPQGANMGLSCGNPTAIAQLTPGQVVLDLGSGGGFDVFLAGPKVGATGFVIGVDMTPQMLEKARANKAAYVEQSGLDNVEFRLGEIEHLPVADQLVDVVISNCVINLSPDKPQVWRDMARVLKPGGRVAVSDMALLRPLPPTILEMLTALVGCVAGAVLIDDYRQMIEQAGFERIALTPKPEYVAALSQANDPLYAQLIDALPEGHAIGDYVTSLDVVAYKPTSCGCCGC